MMPCSLTMMLSETSKRLEWESDKINEKHIAFKYKSPLNGNPQ